VAENAQGQSSAGVVRSKNSGVLQHKGRDHGLKPPLKMQKNKEEGKKGWEDRRGLRGQPRKMSGQAPDAEKS